MTYYLGMGCSACCRKTFHQYGPTSFLWQGFDMTRIVLPAGEEDEEDEEDEENDEYDSEESGTEESGNDDDDEDAESQNSQTNAE